MADHDYSQSPSARKQNHAGGDRGDVEREDSRSPNIQVDESRSDAGNSAHIKVDEPKRPQLLRPSTLRGQSAFNVSEALRFERSREEQETLLGAHEEADDDGCYPPRITDEPRAPNPHKSLPVYATIHKIRRLVIASIGALNWMSLYGICANILTSQMIRTAPIN